jgi:carbon storage regulator
LTKEQAPAWKGSMAMLVLTRKRDDVIRIGHDVVIRVIRTGKGSVKIGIEAPPEVRVIRGELVPMLDHFDASEDASHPDALVLQH